MAVGNCFQQSRWIHSFPYKARFSTFFCDLAHGKDLENNGVIGFIREAMRKICAIRQKYFCFLSMLLIISFMQFAWNCIMFDLLLLFIELYTNFTHTNNHQRIRIWNATVAQLIHNKTFSISFFAFIFCWAALHLHSVSSGFLFVYCVVMVLLLCLQFNSSQCEWQQNEKMWKRLITVGSTHQARWSLTNNSLVCCCCALRRLLFRFLLKAYSNDSYNNQISYKEFTKHLAAPEQEQQKIVSDEIGWTLKPEKSTYTRMRNAKRK